MSESRLDYDRDTMLAVLRDLEQIVVSLDRIGSATHDQSEREQDAALAGFVREWRVSEKLSRARRTLSEPFSDELGPGDMDELERELAGVVPWSSTGRAPRET